MTPIKQTIADARKGDCLRACVASLLDMPIEKVPNFVGMFPDDVPEGEFGWFEFLFYWLQFNNYRHRGHFGTERLDEYEGIDGYVLVSVKSTLPDSSHACIYSIKDKCIVHDPEPGEPAIRADAPMIGFHWIEKI